MRVTSAPAATESGSLAVKTCPSISPAPCARVTAGATTRRAQPSRPQTSGRRAAGRRGMPAARRTDCSARGMVWFVQDVQLVQDRHRPPLRVRPGCLIVGFLKLPRPIIEFQVPDQKKRGVLLLLEPLPLPDLSAVSLLNPDQHRTQDED